LFSSYIMIITGSLRKLVEVFGHSGKSGIVEHVNNKIGKSKTTYHNYMEYYRFL
ncbi:hypothetical protein BC830DRAFT_1050146, partial [Chytriomyces sp. MP71]